MRRSLQSLDDRPAVVWRNHEASRDVAELEPATRAISTYVLQEYFIPEQNFAAFATAMSTLIQRAGAAVLNVSIRHAPEDPLPYQLHATLAQFEVAYPQSGTLRSLRASAGAQRFSHALWDRYAV